MEDHKQLFAIAACVIADSGMIGEDVVHKLALTTRDTWEHMSAHMTVLRGRYWAIGRLEGRVRTHGGVWDELRFNVTWHVTAVRYMFAKPPENNVVISGKRRDVVFKNTIGTHIQTVYYVFPMRVSPEVQMILRGAIRVWTVELPRVDTMAALRVFAKWMRMRSNVATAKP